MLKKAVSFTQWLFGTDATGMKITTLNNFYYYFFLTTASEIMSVFLRLLEDDDNSIAVHTIMNFEREIALISFNLIK